jgi:hypothetical protein
MKTKKQCKKDALKSLLKKMVPPLPMVDGKKPGVAIVETEITVSKPKSKKDKKELLKKLLGKK